MAINFAGGTDQVFFTGTGANSFTEGCIAGWMKTTQATGDTAPVTMAQGSSENGPVVVLNNTANKLTIVWKNTGGGFGLILASTSNVNTGSWFHYAFNFSTGSSAPCELFINGTQENSANSSGTLSVSFAGQTYLGDSNDAYWATYNGDMAELGLWNRKLTQGEITALAQGFSPQLVAPTSLRQYCPFRGSERDRRAFSTFGGVTGTTFTDHPPILGGLA